MDSNDLEKLKERLYKKEETFQERQKRTKIRQEIPEELPSSWLPEEEKEKKLPKSMKNILIASVIILSLVLLGGILYFALSGTNIISSRNIDIEIKGPSSIEAGKLASFSVFIENKNKTAIEMADLIFEFPENTFSRNGDSLFRQRISVGKINPGENIKKITEAVFFGLGEEEKTINITLEYRLTDSNAIFAKEEDYTLKLSAPSFGLSFSLPKEINSKQEFILKIEAVSNSETIAKNLSLQVNYPAGFQFIDADPKPASGNNIWFAGDIAPLQKKEISIKGFVEGQDLEEKAFGASVGVLDDNGVLRPFGTVSEIAVLKKVPLNLSIFINGQDFKKNVAQSGEQLRIDLQWLNNLTTHLRDAKIELEIKGRAQNEQSISVSQGFYRTLDKKIIWNTSSMPDLASIDIGETGRAQISFSINDSQSLANLNDKNLSIILDARISGIGTSEQFENQEILTAVSKEIKIASNLQLTAIALYYTGPFKNSGPLPPKVDKETTYTMLWSLGGNTNDFSDARISAFLPSYVRWLNVVSPSETDIKFNERDGAIVWNIGNIPAGTGTVLPSKEIAFQVGFIPSLSQAGSSPILVDKLEAEADDDFTEQSFTAKISSLDTMLNYDERFKYDEGKVIK
ncbi:MAG: hypothetical protein HY773_02465 [Candidatus Terrybacteria bacterium]|nr:hypothetical protein [Candidatus Terrybacteria bacterium]